MSLSSQITGMILEMLGSSGTIEIQRNELAHDRLRPEPDKLCYRVAFHAGTGLYCREPQRRRRIYQNKACGDGAGSEGHARSQRRRR